ncbi:MAG: SCO family protein [Bacteroidota bacterium]
MKPSIQQFLFLTIILIALVSCEEERTLKNYYPIGVGEVNWDTIYQTVPTFEMRNQDGDIISREKREELIRVFHFYCGNCENGDEVFQNMSSLQEAYKQDTLIFLLSMSMSPSVDDAERLQELGGSHNADATKWDILSGDSLFTRKLVASGFHIFIEETDSSMKAPSQLVLVDKEGKVRGKYYGAKDEEIAKLKADIEVLKNEYIPKYDWWRFW